MFIAILSRDKVIRNFCRCTIVLICWKYLWGDTPHSRAKNKPQQNGRRGEFVFRIKPHFCQRLSEGSNKPCVHQDPGKRHWPHKRLTQTCPAVSRSLQWRRGSVVACCRVGSSGCSSTCMGSFKGDHHYLHYLHHSLKVKVKSLSRVWLFATLWTIAHQAPSSMGFSRQEYWSGLPFPSPGDLPDPGIERRSPALQADTLTSKPPGKPP